MHTSLLRKRKGWVLAVSLLVCVSIGFMGFATPTTTTVARQAGSNNPSALGEHVWFEVTLTGVQTPSGIVELYAGTTPLLSKSPITSTTTAFDVSTLSAGTHSISAKYLGDLGNDYDPSTSASIVQTVVAKADTTTEVASDKASPVTGEMITFTATVASVSGTPTGSVDFFYTPNGGSKTQFAADVSLDGGGQAQATIAFNAADSTVVIEVEYSGDGNYKPSDNSSTPFSQTVNIAPTKTVVTSDKSAPVTGEDVTFTATVTVDPSSLGAGTPTGNVTFVVKDSGSTTIDSDTVALDVFGEADFTTDLLKASGANYSVIATYDPTLNAPALADDNYAESTDTLTGQAVGKATTEISITSVQDEPSLQFVSYIVTGTVTVVPPGSGVPAVPTVPTGTVTVFDGSVARTEYVNSDGSWTCTLASTSAGAKTLTATYGTGSPLSGDTNFNGDNVTQAHTVNPSTTKTTVVSDINPALIGETAKFTATVTADYPGGVAPTGTVNFFKDGGGIGAGSYGSGVWTLDYPVSDAGSYAITAVYGGNGVYHTSTSPSYTQTVNNADTTTVIATNLASGTYVGQSYSVEGTVSINSPAAGVTSISGQVIVSDGSATCSDTDLVWNTTNSNWDWSCPYSVSPPPANNPLTSTTAGTKTITATFVPDATHDDLNSSMATTSHPVNKRTASISIAAVDDGGGDVVTDGWYTGETGTFTATVSDGSGSGLGGTPAGTVTFHIEDAVGVTIKDAGPYVLNGSGVATCSSVTLYVSQNQVKVVVSYSGDASFATLVKDDFRQTVTGPTPGNFAITEPALDPSSLADGIGLEVTYAGGGFPADGTVYICVSGPEPTHTVSDVVLTNASKWPASAATFHPTTAGVYTIHARYDRGSNGPSDCSDLTDPLDELATSVLHTLVGYATTTDVSLDPASVYVNQPTTITAEVNVTGTYTPPSSPGLPGKMVSFTTVGIPVGSSGTLSSSTCVLGGTADAGSCSNVTFTPTAASGNSEGYKIRGMFPADTNYTASDGEATLTVRKREPTITVVCDPSSVYIDQATTCTVTVADGSGAPNSTVPTGTGSVAATLAGPVATAGVFSPSDSGPLSQGAYSTTYTPGAGDAGTGTATTTVSAAYKGSQVYLVPSDVSVPLEVKLRPTETTLTWNDSNGGHEPLFIDETGSVTITVTDMGPAASASPPEGLFTVTADGGTLGGSCATLTPVPGRNDQSRCTRTYTLTGASEDYVTDTVRATYSPSTSTPSQTHEESNGRTEIPVSKRPTKASLICGPAATPELCTVKITDVASRGDKSPPGGNVIRQEDGSAFTACSTTSPDLRTCTKTITDPHHKPFEVVTVEYSPTDNKHIHSFALDTIERGLPDGIGTFLTIDVEALILAANTTCLALAASSITMSGIGELAGLVPDGVITALFGGTTIPVSDIAAAIFSGISLGLDAAELLICSDLDGDGIPGSIETLLGLSDAMWDTDGDGMGDLAEIDEAGGLMDLAFLFTFASSTCPNPLDWDSDNDGLSDGEEGGLNTHFCNPDTDGDTIGDGDEVATWTNDVRDQADPTEADTDGDGIRDDVENASHSCTYVNEADSDDDGLDDGVEDWNADGTYTPLTSGTGDQASTAWETNPCDFDTDGDGLSDGEEFHLLGGIVQNPDTWKGLGSTPFVNVPVVSMSVGSTNTVPALDTDSDDDGLSDYEEVNVTGTDPLNWDSDGDSLSDLNELMATGGVWPTRSFTQVSDPLDPDTDDDELLDNIEYSGTGMGTSHDLGGSDDIFCPFVNDDDSDDDGLQDGYEDDDHDGVTDPTDRNGFWDNHTVPTNGSTGQGSGETNPCDPDTDNDGLSDGEEAGLFVTVGGSGSMVVSTTAGDTVPALDDDSDNDGLSDYEEVNITGTDALDADTDGDNISDANELIATTDTWPKRAFYQESDPLDPDTDDDYLPDDMEWRDVNLVVKGTNLGDPSSLYWRAEGGDPDNLCPFVNDDDSDDDGLQDGVEDANKDGTYGVMGDGMNTGGMGSHLGLPNKNGAPYWETDLCDPDTDDDGLLDGEEVGLIGGAPLSGRPGPGETFTPVLYEAVSTTLPEGTTDFSLLSGYTHTPDPSPGTQNNKIAPYIFTPVAGTSTVVTVPALDVDSDDDGLSDYEEVNITGTAPLDQDTDNDTLMDADELIATGGTVYSAGPPVVGPRRTFDQESDPLDINTDDDDLFDPQEYYDANAVRYGSGLSLLAGGLGGIRDDRSNPSVCCPFVNDDDSDDDGIQDGEVVTISPPGVIRADGTAFSYTHYEDFIDLDEADQDQPVVPRTVPTLGDGEQSKDTDWDVCDADSDDDGLLDGEEIAIGTDPDDYDTDDDGRNDWHEVTGGGPIPTDPFDPDTDDDGLLDSVEVYYMSNTTNPTNADTDGDGLCDGGTGTPWMKLYPSDLRVVVNPICKSCATPGLNDCGATGGVRTGSVDGIGDHPNPHGYGEDKDGDGQWDGSIGDEWQSGEEGTPETDPNQYDTDGDAEGDGIEVLGFSTSRQYMIPPADLFGHPITVIYPACGCLEPLILDTDGDGLTDGYEDNNHDGNFDFLPSDFDYAPDPLPGPPQPNPNETNPCDPDTDHDELTDWEERNQRQPLLAYPVLPLDNDGDGLIDEDPVDGIDNDLDGLIDEDSPEGPIELTFNPTNPLDHDTDNDRLLDGEEVYWVCVAVTYTQLDNDGDALIDEDPVDGLDNDGDGLFDEDPVDFFVRFVQMLDPTCRDSDSDGFIDGLDDDPCNSELIPLLQPVQMQPIDTDGDGFADDDEIVAGTHPNDPEDYPTAYCMIDLDFDQEIDDRLWLEPTLCCGIANSVAIDIDSNVLIDARVRIIAPRDVKKGDFDGDGSEDDYRYVVEYAFGNYRVVQPRIVLTIDDYNGDLVIDHAEVVKK